MPNILSHVGASLQSELCAWTMLGVLNSTFDAALFRINANLKQVWGMRMPDELSLSVQRVLRTSISGVVLVQCFTTHLYLAAYIVLLYPVFLVTLHHLRQIHSYPVLCMEERPALLLPWLLVSAVRGLLCELLGLALGLTSCLLVGATRSPCVIFVLGKLAKITPALYMWMLVFSYYRSLKISTAFMTFPAGGGGPDFGLEQAVRRRRTKSLLAEPELRRNIITYTYEDRIMPAQRPTGAAQPASYGSRVARGTSHTEEDPAVTISALLPIPSDYIRNYYEATSFDDWLVAELPQRRDGDRILDQFVAMILNVAAYVEKNGRPVEPTVSRVKATSAEVRIALAAPAPARDSRASTLASVEPETPPHVSSAGRAGSRTAPGYILEFPRIFNKRRSEPPQPLLPRSIDERALNRSDALAMESWLTPELRRDESAQTDGGGAPAAAETSSDLVETCQIYFNPQKDKDDT